MLHPVEALGGPLEVLPVGQDSAVRYSVTGRHKDLYEALRCCVAGDNRNAGVTIGTMLGVPADLEVLTLPVCCAFLYPHDRKMGRALDEAAAFISSRSKVFG